MMERESGIKKASTQTPRRTIGLSRISPRSTQTPPSKRPKHEPSTINAAATTSTALNDDDSLVTPTKSRKSLGRFVFSPRPEIDPKKHQPEKENKSTDVEADILHMKSHLEAYEKFKGEKSKLEHLIKVWHDGGVEALRLLQEEIQPQQEIEQILTHLNIPTDMFDIQTNE